jgi:uncharacterized membrane protein
VHGFLYDQGNFTMIDHPETVGSDMWTQAFGINDPGQIVGMFRTVGSEGVLYVHKAFVKTESTFTTLTLPFASTNYQGATGINNAGDIVGYFDTHGFLDKAGAFTQIDVPGATGTFPSAINRFGHIVGWYGDATGRHGFLHQGDTFTPLDVPGATDTEAYGINSFGHIVGWYIDPSGKRHGFFARPQGKVPPGKLKRPKDIVAGPWPPIKMPDTGDPPPFRSSESAKTPQ